MTLPFRIRQSTLESAKCPYRLKRHHIDGIPSPAGEPAIRGTHFHQMAKDYVDYLVANQRECDYAYAEEIRRRFDGQESADLFAEWVSRNVFDPDVIAATEYNILLGPDLKPVPEGTPVAESPFSATFDRLELYSQTEAKIPDYKTNWAVFEPDTIQASFYPWLLWKIMPRLQEITFELDFVRWNVQKARTFNVDDLGAAERYIIGLVNRIYASVEADDWPAIINDKCAWCVLECPLVKGGLSRKIVGQIQDADEARKMAAELYTLKKQIKRIHANLKNYCAGTGPIEIDNDIALGFRRRDTRKFDPEQVVELNEQYGFDELRGLRVDAKELKRIEKDYPDYVEKLKPKVSTTTVFDFSDVEEEE